MAYFEDDYVILSDIEIEPSGASLRSSGCQKQKHHTPGAYITTDPSSSTSTTSNRHSSTRSVEQPQRPAREQSHSDTDSDLDLEEIEYDYGPDNDTLLIMPAMLKDYSHHATNYHPELWTAAIPGSYQAQPSLARVRQEGQSYSGQLFRRPLAGYVSRHSQHLSWSPERFHRKRYHHEPNLLEHLQLGWPGRLRL
ncbi:hypothetical protein BG004_000633 [Podila humilis]|nr:hypothetical protein BG004_000633 [Podila humilis]